MPSIPRFQVRQEDDWIFIEVYVPYVRVSEMEFHVDGVNFSFYCKPYLLKLQFPHEVVDDDRTKAVYDPSRENGTIVIHLPKMNPGEYFEDLDLVTKLLQRKPVQVQLNLGKNSTPIIEVMDSVESHPLDDQKKQGEQRRKAIQTDSSLLDLENQHSIEQCWHGELSEIVALPDPDGTPIHQRSCIREAAEDAHFDVERYLMDFCNEQEDIYYNTAMKFEPFWNNFPQVHLYDKAPKKMICPMKKCEPEVETSISDICKSLNKLELGQDLAKEAVIAFSDEDQELLRRLPHKEYLIKPDSSEEDHVLGGLLDILIGFTYDHLISEGDHGIESAWTISTLSPTLSWLDTSSSTKSIVRTAVRRMLSYPFLRQYDLAIHVMNMTNSILKCGKRAVLRVLLQIYRIFEKSETQYLLNSLYVQDYCVWIQTIEDSLLLNLSSVFSSSISSFSKEQTGWALIEMEAILEDSSVSDSEDESDESDQSNESED